MTILMKMQAQYPSMDDARLAHQARADPEAFAELYRRHVASVYRYHRVHTGNDKDAEDLTSQTFIAALEGIHSYRGTGSYIAWLMGIAARRRARPDSDHGICGSICAMDRTDQPDPVYFFRRAAYCTPHGQRSDASQHCIGRFCKPGKYSLGWLESEHAGCNHPDHRRGMDWKHVTRKK